jgi:hypothetical protein
VDREVGDGARPRNTCKIGGGLAGVVGLVAVAGWGSRRLEGEPVRVAGTGIAKDLDKVGTGGQSLQAEPLVVGSSGGLGKDVAGCVEQPGVDVASGVGKEDIDVVGARARSGCDELKEVAVAGGVDGEVGDGARPGYDCKIGGGLAGIVGCDTLVAVGRKSRDARGLKSETV